EGEGRTNGGNLKDTTSHWFKAKFPLYRAKRLCHWPRSKAINGGLTKAEGEGRFNGGNEGYNGNVAFQAMTAMSAVVRSPRAITRVLTVIEENLAPLAVVREAGSLRNPMSLI
ncbi:hypothetical protein HAX54_026616, partial [Datura stramonium]|nr:hypothetical protein [Datura stramonium]